MSEHIWASEDEKREFQDSIIPPPGRMTREEVMESARKHGAKVERLIDALEDFYMNGFQDESSGDVDCQTGHFYRVNRWIVTTNTQGFHDMWSFESVAEAIKEFQKLEAEYAEWCGDDDA